MTKNKEQKKAMKLLRNNVKAADEILKILSVGISELAKEDPDKYGRCSDGLTEAVRIIKKFREENKKKPFDIISYHGGIYNR